MDIFSVRMIVIYFLYGLSFFTMAFAIIFQARKNSSFILAKSVWFLSGFGLFQAFAEWAKVAKILQLYGINLLSIPLLHFIDSVTIVISFIFLFLFGIHLLVDSTGTHKHYKFIPLVLAVIWSIKFIITDLIIFPTENFQAWTANSIALARYLIAFPGALLVSVGLLLQVPQLKRLELKSAYYNCRAAAVVFAAYGFFSGLLPFPTRFWPGNVLNTATFLQVTGLPVQVFRVVLGILMAYTIIKTINIFHVEQQKRIEDADRIRTVMEERERFSRDLHDGIIQSVYGARMLLNLSQSMFRKNEKMQASERLDEVKEMLDNTVDELRVFMKDLHRDTDKEESLQQTLTKLISDLRRLSVISINLKNNIEGDVYLSQKQQTYVFYIVKEALFNVIKHAHANKCSITLERKDNSIIIKVTDDGIGYNLQHYLNSGCTENKGLLNMKFRAQQLGCTLTINTGEGKGTEVVLHIPTDVMQSSA
ncbi:MAG: sensor histidine kinase [Dethiobacter sp.]|nr:sensor histidine kinase [Dethiobacter sp.]